MWLWVQSVILNSLGRGKSFTKDELEAKLQIEFMIVLINFPTKNW